MRAILAEIIAEIHDAANDDLERAVLTLTAELADLRASIAELRLVQVIDRSKPVNLPALPRSRPGLN
jgi:hypothetical protein